MIFVYLIVGGQTVYVLEELSGAFSHAPKMDRSGWLYRKVLDGINISKYNDLSSHESPHDSNHCLMMKQLR
jgi:hypothetical protein